MKTSPTATTGSRLERWKSRTSRNATRRAVTERKAKRLVFAGKGKITIDSGAAGSVMPKGMLLNGTTIEELATRNRAKYVAAHGARMENQGEKKIRFKKSGGKVLNSITFQVTDVGKPWRR